MHSSPSSNPREQAEALRKEIALFRYGVIAELLQFEAGHRGLYKRLAEKADREHTIPGSLRRRVAAETIRGWLRAYRTKGFDGLVPSVRADDGGTRSIPSHVVDLLCHLKEETPELTVPALIKTARTEHAAIVHEETRLPESTVHRLLARRGLTRKKKSEAGTNDRRRFEHENAGDLWMSDVMYGPKIRVDGRMRQTYLIAFIDDATRVIPFATFTFSEGTVAFLQVLEQAIRRRGIPKRLYVDNGSAFRSKALALVCAKLGIALIHAKPYMPEGKGKIERWFRTVRMQYLQPLAHEHMSSLDAMNRTLSAWIEGEYHHAPHGGLGKESPSHKWARASADVRMPDANVGEIFLAETNRRVGRDRTVTLDGVAFEVDATLVGEQVVLRYDGAKKPQKRTVEVWHRGSRIEIARRVDALANCFVKRNGNTRSLEISTSSAEVGDGLAMRNLVASGSGIGEDGN